jgi:hypothetical protein
MVVLAILAGTSGVGCTPPLAAADAHEELHEALARAKRAQSCAAELLRATDLDPEATARLIEVEPAALAPWGGAPRARKAIGEIILARAVSAQDDALAAQSLAGLGDDASSEQEALCRQKIAHSLAVSSALCVAANVAENGTLAQRR